LFSGFFCENRVERVRPELVLGWGPFVAYEVMARRHAKVLLGKFGIRYERVPRFAYASRSE
jgi:hypothetical protein